MDKVLIRAYENWFTCLFWRAYKIYHNENFRKLVFLVFFLFIKIKLQMNGVVITMGIHPDITQVFPAI